MGKLHNKLMPDRLFSVLFLVQRTLVAAWFLFHSCSLLTFCLFYFILSLFVVVSQWGFCLFLSVAACMLQLCTAFLATLHVRRLWNLSGVSEAMETGQGGCAKLTCCFQKASSCAAWPCTSPCSGEGRAREGACFFAHSTASAVRREEEPCYLCLSVPLLCLHFVHLWLSPSWL